jgi:hypothetical protein
MPIPSEEPGTPPIRLRLGAADTAGAEEADGRSRVMGSRSPIRLGRVHCAQSFVEFLQVKPAIPGGITKDRGDVVPFGV